MLHVYALTASPAARTALQLAQEEHKTKGFRAVFGVVLMFLILCGGVWMLLQSSFGAKQAYLVSSVAFWGSWLVLSLIWLTGVPGIPLLGIPRSTPKYYGPQGAEQRWEVAGPNGPEDLRKRFDTFENSAEGRDGFITVDDSVTDPATQQGKAAAEAAASEMVAEEYAVDLGVGAADVTLPGVVRIAETQLARSGGQFRYARITFGPAEPNDTLSVLNKDLITRIKPKTLTLVLDSGSLAAPTYWSILLFGVLFAGHLGMLVKYELNRIPQPSGIPERVPAGV